jgi:hypothetical protein
MKGATNYKGDGKKKLLRTKLNHSKPRGKHMPQARIRKSNRRGS